MSLKHRQYNACLYLRHFLTLLPFCNRYYPGALYLLSLFYTRKEIATRISILYSGNIFATSFSGLIAAATCAYNMCQFPHKSEDVLTFYLFVLVATLDGAHNLKGWVSKHLHTSGTFLLTLRQQWLFIIEGTLTFGVALIAIFLLPDFPLTTRWLTPDERKLAHERIERDTVGIEPSKGSKAGFLQAIRDPRLYLLCLIQNMHLSACSFNNFFPTVSILHSLNATSSNIK